MLRFEPIPDTPVDGPTIPWLSDAAAFATHVANGAALATLNDPSTATKATLHAAVSVQHIFVSVRVRKATHENTRTGGDIWDGDALQIGFDACPLASAAFDVDETAVTPFSAQYAFALTSDGPQAFAHLHGNPRKRGQRSDLVNAGLCTVTREKNITAYTVAIPWSELQTAAGISPTLGLSVQVNDRTDDGEVRLSFGKGIGAQMRPRQFALVNIGPPPADCEFVHLATIKHWLGKVDDEALKIVASRSSKKVRLIAGVHDVRTLRLEHTVPGSDRLNRTALIWQAGWLPRAEDALHVSVHCPGVQGLMANHLPTTNPRNVFRVMKEEMQYLYGDLDLPPVFHRHLKDLTAIVESTLEAAITARRGIEEQITQIADISARVAENITISLDPRYRRDHAWREANTYGWHTHTSREAALILAATSSIDRSRQPYRVTVPRNYRVDDTTPRPLIIWLHGSGNPSVLHFLNHGLLAPETLACCDDAFIIEPWARGNAWYQDAAGTDVFDAIDDLRRTFPIDTARIYLGGHSMGASGTLRLAAQRTNVFRALAIASLPAHSLADATQIAQIHMPVSLWHGAVDALCPASTPEKVAAMLRANGCAVRCDIAPGVGHSMSGQTQADLCAWLLTQ